MKSNDDIVDISWPEFQKFITFRRSPFQFIECEKFYHLRAFDGLFKVKCTLDRKASDQTDIYIFEKNFKGLGNQPLGKTLIQKAVSITVKTDGSGVASGILKVPKGGRTVISGRTWFETPEHGDTVIVDILRSSSKINKNSYTDFDVPLENQKYYIGPNGYADVKPFIRTGYVYEGDVINIIGKKGNGNSDTMRVNIIWGL